MNFFSDHLLSAIVWLPLLGAIVALSFPRTQHSGVRGFAIAVTLVDFVLSIWMAMRFVSQDTGMQLVEKVAWVPSFGIQYSVGVDGLSILMLLLTTFLGPLVIIASYSGVQTKVREYIVCLLFLQTGMLGAFVATDLFLFYVFWELMLIPMYFLIGIWGGQRKIYAAIKFFIYTMAGSLLMLVAIIYTVWAVSKTGGMTFDWAVVSARLATTDLGGAETWLFLAFALAFAIKVPMFPFHTWLPDAHVEAPTGGSVILAGVLLKLGTFGFLRYALWLFPEAGAAFLPAIGLIAVIGIVYGALVAMVQEDLKRLVAYSSVSHLGFVMLGIAAMTVTGVTGGVFQMVNHGISTGALFLLVGVIYERRHTRMIEDFGGIAKVMPRFAFIWVFIVLSSIGLPGLNGFVGEFMILIGAFQSTGIGSTVATGDVAWAGIITAELVAITGVVLLATGLSRQVPERIGNITRFVAVAAAAAVAALLTAPPVGEFAGGLLIRPLTGAAHSTEMFSEVFATLAVVAASGVIFAAVYLLWATQRVFFGPLTRPENQRLKDLTGRETLMLLPLVVMALLLGLFPQPALDAITPTMTHYATHIRQGASLPMMAGMKSTPAAATAPKRLQPTPVRRPLRLAPNGPLKKLRTPRDAPLRLPFRDRLQRQRGAQP